MKEEQILDLIENTEWLMEPSVKAFWDKVKIPPQKWQHSPWGDCGGGFWVIAIIGRTCIYYNDIEDGFNASEYEQFGAIKNYYCNQSDLLSYMNGLVLEFWKIIR